MTLPSNANLLLSINQKKEQLLHRKRSQLLKGQRAGSKHFISQIMFFPGEVCLSQEKISNKPFLAFEKCQWNPACEDTRTGMERKYLIHKAFRGNLHTWPDRGSCNILLHIVSERAA